MHRNSSAPLDSTKGNSFTLGEKKQKHFQSPILAGPPPYQYEFSFQNDMNANLAMREEERNEITDRNIFDFVLFTLIAELTIILTSIRFYVSMRRGFLEKS